MSCRSSFALYVYLFMAKLSMFIDRRVVSGLWNPLPASRGGIAISHSLLADDFILSFSASARCCRVVRIQGDRVMKRLHRKNKLFLVGYVLGWVAEDTM